MNVKIIGLHKDERRKAKTTLKRQESQTKSVHFTFHFPFKKKLKECRVWKSCFLCALCLVCTHSKYVMTC